MEVRDLRDRGAKIQSEKKKVLAYNCIFGREVQISESFLQHLRLGVIYSFVVVFSKSLQPSA